MEAYENSLIAQAEPDQTVRFLSVAYNKINQSKMKMSGCTFSFYSYLFYSRTGCFGLRGI